MKKTKNLPKMVGVRSLEDFAGSTRSFDVKKLNTKESVNLEQKVEFIRFDSDRMVGQ